VKPIATGVWQVDGPGLRMAGGVVMPLSSTVLRLADRSLLLYSPVKLDDAQAAAIAAEGEVSHIVAPNLFHHLYVNAAAARWPNAAIHGPPGLAAKRSDIAFSGELGSASIDGSVDVELVGGAPRINEVLLFHRPSGALLCADFMFNVTKPANLRTRFALSMMGVGGGELKQSRLWRLLARGRAGGRAGNRAAARASIDRMLSWQITTVVPVHGDAVTQTPASLAPKLSRSYGGPVTPALPA
jgi:hypothetical protein